MFSETLQAEGSAALGSVSQSYLALTEGVALGSQTPPLDLVVGVALGVYIHSLCESFPEAMEVSEESETGVESAGNNRSKTRSALGLPKFGPVMDSVDGRFSFVSRKYFWNERTCESERYIWTWRRLIDRNSFVLVRKLLELILR